MKNKRVIIRALNSAIYDLEEFILFIEKSKTTSGRTKQKQIEHYTAQLEEYKTALEELECLL